MASLKSAIYARLEETSFRSGVAVCAGVLATASRCRPAPAGGAPVIRNVVVGRLRPAADIDR